jgi:hypothetical protein
MRVFPYPAPRLPRTPAGDESQCYLQVLYAGPAMTGRAPSGKADIIESWPSVSVQLTIRWGRCTVRPSTSTRVPGISLGLVR